MSIDWDKLYEVAHILLVAAGAKDPVRATAALVLARELSPPVFAAHNERVSGGRVTVGFTPSLPCPPEPPPAPLKDNGPTAPVHPEEDRLVRLMSDLERHAADEAVLDMKAKTARAIATKLRWEIEKVSQLIADRRVKA